MSKQGKYERSEARDRDGGGLYTGGGLLSREDRWCLEEAGALTGMMEAKLAVAASLTIMH